MSNTKSQESVDNISKKQEKSKNKEFVTFNLNPEILTSISILIGAVIISLSIIFSFRGMNLTQTNAENNKATTVVAQDDNVAPEKTKVNINQIKNLFKDGNIKFGNNDKLLFVEFSDPSCPYCHIAGGENGALNKQVGQQFLLKADGGTYVAPVPEMRKLVNEGKASFAWFYSNGHGNGELATEALYCAYEKGKFWEAHDLLMSSSGYSMINDTVKNDRSKSSDLSKFLSSAVDSNFMQNCLESKKYNAKISENQTLAGSLGVSGTPGFFVNEQNFAGAYSFTDMESVVKSILK